jgi:hypothetical protein
MRDDGIERRWNGDGIEINLGVKIRMQPNRRMGAAIEGVHKR